MRGLKRGRGLLYDLRYFFKKAKIISKLVEVDQNLILGCDEYIQFMLLAYYIMYLKDE